jgi:hypothetical protein
MGVALCTMNYERPDACCRLTEAVGKVYKVLASNKPDSGKRSEVPFQCDEE